MAKEAIDHQSAAYTYGKKNAGIGAACAYGIDQISLREDDRLAGQEVGCRDGERHAQFFKGLNFQDAVQESSHAVVGTKPKPGDGVPGEVLKANDGGDFFQFFGRD